MQTGRLKNKNNEQNSLQSSIKKLKIKSDLRIKQNKKNLSSKRIIKQKVQNQCQNNNKYKQDTLAHHAMEVSIQLKPWDVFQQNHNKQQKTYRQKNHDQKNGSIKMYQDRQKTSLRSRHNNIRSQNKNHEDQKQLLNNCAYNYKTSVEQKLKWHLQLEFMMKRKKKTSQFLKFKQYGHYRSRTLHAEVQAFSPQNKQKRIQMGNKSQLIQQNIKKIKESILNKTYNQANFSTIDQRPEKLFSQTQIQFMYKKFPKSFNLTGRKQAKVKSSQHKLKEFSEQLGQNIEKDLYIGSKNTVRSQQYGGLLKNRKKKQDEINRLAQTNYPVDNDKDKLNSQNSRIRGKSVQIQTKFGFMPNRKSRKIHIKSQTLNIQQSIDAIKGIQGNGISVLDKLKKQIQGISTQNRQESHTMRQAPLNLSMPIHNEQKATSKLLKGYKVIKLKHKSNNLLKFMNKSEFLENQNQIKFKV